MNIGKRIGVENHQIGELPRLDSSEIIQFPEEPRRVQSRSLEGCQRRQPPFHHQCEFVMQAESRTTETAEVAPGRRIESMVPILLLIACRREKAFLTRWTAKLINRIALEVNGSAISNSRPVHPRGRPLARAVARSVRFVDLCRDQDP
jgi:hypothetical protein